MLWQLEEIQKRAPDVRKLFDIKEIIFDKNWMMKQIGRESKNKDIYYMYRNVCKPKDEAIIKKSGLRYDVTVIPPFMMGDEFIKTAGHYHPLAVEDYTFPEVYQVLEGEAIFLIQKVENFENFNLLDVAYAKAGEGEVFVVPPNFGHITINASNKRLVMANWVASNFQSIYEPIKRMCGASYFFTDEGWVRNHRYGLIPNLREVKCQKMDDMYNYVLDLKRLEFLKNPLARPSEQGVPVPPEPKKPAKKETPKEEKCKEENAKETTREEKLKEEPIKEEKAEEIKEGPAKEEPVKETIEEQIAEEEAAQEEAILEEMAPKEPGAEQPIPIEFPSDETSPQENSGQQEAKGKYNPVGLWQ